MSVHKLHPAKQDAFEEFWQRYPRKIGKLAAKKSYARALKEDSAENIAEGLTEFLKHLPDEQQFIPHCTTWLNQGRWMDEYTDTSPSGWNLK